MWVHPGRLEHLLPPRAYFEPDQVSRENERIFRPSWQLAALRADLADDGASRELDVAGMHVVVRRLHGALEAAGSEVPGRRRTSWMPLPVTVLGELVFVALDAGAPRLVDWLDAASVTALQAALTPDHRAVWSATLPHPCNWKVALENVLETYHLPVLHQNALARRPELFRLFTGTPPRRDTHQLRERSTTWVDSMGAGSALYRSLAERMRPGFDATYVHHHAMPNLIVAWSHLVTFLQVVLPTSATTSESRVHLHLWEGESASAAAPFAAPLLRALARRLAPAFMARVLAEDAAIYLAVQAGLAGSPHRGVLSAREERVHAFQRFVRDATER